MKGPRWATGVLIAIIAGMLLAAGAVLLTKKVQSAQMYVQPKKIELPTNPEIVHCEGDWCAVNKKALGEGIQEIAMELCGWVK